MKMLVSATIRTLSSSSILRNHLLDLGFPDAGLLRPPSSVPVQLGPTLFSDVPSERLAEEFALRPAFFPGDALSLPDEGGGQREREDLRCPHRGSRGDSRLILVATLSCTASACTASATSREVALSSMTAHEAMSSGLAIHPGRQQATRAA